MNDSLPLAQPYRVANKRRHALGVQARPGDGHDRGCQLAGGCRGQQPRPPENCAAPAVGSERGLAAPAVQHADATRVGAPAVGRATAAQVQDLLAPYRVVTLHRAV